MGIEDRQYQLSQFGEKPDPEVAAAGILGWLQSNYSPIVPLGSFIEDDSGVYGWGSPTVPAKEGTPSAIKVANMGIFGDVTIPKAGKIAGQAAIFVVAALIAVVSEAALLMKSPTISRGVKAAASATPIGAGVKAAAGK